MNAALLEEVLRQAGVGMDAFQPGPRRLNRRTSAGRVKVWLALRGLGLETKQIAELTGSKRTTVVMAFDRAGLVKKRPPRQKPARIEPERFDPTVAARYGRHT